MSGEQREIAGFLCRWTLLGLVAAGLAVAVFAGLVATSAVAEEVSADVVLSDGVARTGDTVLLTGHVRPRLGYDAPSLLLYRRAGEATLSGASARGGRVYWWATAGEPGLERIAFRGQPYGPLAGLRRDVRLLTIAPDEELWLVDARWAERVSRSRRHELAALLATLDARGAVALFHAGPPSVYARCRDALRRRGFRYAAVLETREDSGPPRWDVPLERTSRRVRRWSHNRGIYVVTGDAEVAESAAAAGFPVHLPGPSEAAPARAERVTRHRSLTEMKESLTIRPIP